MSHRELLSCEALPFEEVDAESPLRAKWAEANERIGEVRAEAYFNEVKDTSPYA